MEGQDTVAGATLSAGRPRSRGALPIAVLLAGVLTAATASGLSAQGFGIWEQGTCTMGRGGAAVAEPCPDGSAIYFNPAGLPQGEGLTLSGGATGILATGDFTADLTGRSTDLREQVVPIPHLYASWGVDDRLAVGVGTYVPYGLRTEWPLTFDGRFLGYENSLQTVYVQPTVAYRVDERLSLGAGLAVAIGSVELNQRLDLSPQPVPGGGGLTFGDLGIPFHTQFADAKLDATGATGVGGNFGVQVRATDRITFGARYLTQITLDYEGDATFRPAPTGILLPAGNPFGVPAGTSLDRVLVATGLFAVDGPLADQGVTTSITMPDQLVGGVAVRPADGVTVMADAIWTNWEDFDQVPIDFARAPDQVMVENFQDTWAVRLGGEWRAHPDWTLRGGYTYNDAAAPDETVTPLLPESDRNHFSAGVGWQATGTVSLDVAYLYLAQNDRRGRTWTPGPGRPLNNGLYTFDGHLFGATFTFRF